MTFSFVPLSRALQGEHISAEDLTKSDHRARQQNAGAISFSFKRLIAEDRIWEYIPCEAPWGRSMVYGSQVVIEGVLALKMPVVGCMTA